MKLSVLCNALELAERHDTFVKAMAANTDSHVVLVHVMTKNNLAHSLVRASSPSPLDEEILLEGFTQAMGPVIILGYYTLRLQVLNLLSEIMEQFTRPIEFSIVERLVGRLLMESSSVDSVSSQGKEGVWQLYASGGTLEVNPLPSDSGKQNFIMLPSGKLLGVFECVDSAMPRVIARILQCEREDEMEKMRVKGEHMQGLINDHFSQEHPGEEPPTLQF